MTLHLRVLASYALHLSIWVMSRMAFWDWYFIITSLFLLLRACVLAHSLVAFMEIMAQWSQAK